MNKENFNSSSPLNEEFLATCEEMLDTLEVYLSVFELNPEDPAVAGEILDIFQQLSVSARDIDIVPIASLAEVAANLIQGIIDEKVAADDNLAQSITESAEIIKNFFNSSQEEKADVLQSAAGQKEKLEKIRQDNAISGEKSAPRQSPESQNSAITPQMFKFFKDASRQHLVTISECTGALKNNQFDLGHIDALIRALQGLRGASGFIKHEEMALFAENLEKELIDISDKDWDPANSAEILDTVENFAKGVENFIRENEPKEQAPSPQSPLASAAPSREIGNRSIGQSSKTMRIPVNKINELMNAVEELLIVNAKLDQIKNKISQEAEGANYSKNLNNIYGHFEKTAEAMYNMMLSTRMSPVKSLFGKFKRVILDLSEEQGKIIDVQIIGEETQVDRLVLETLKDPLIHLIRNAVDHGVEKPAERENAGKNARGTVTLRAFNDVNSVVIEIEDNGKGMDWHKIRDKAIEKGLVTPEEAEKMSVSEILDFIFRPGFSTAEQVTSISGRGVGMDVVKTSVKSMNGSVEISTNPGKGSCFIIRLPLAMTIIDALVLRAGDELYSIPTDSVEKF